MRPLTEDESKTVFAKLANYIGKNLVHLVDRQDENYCFRLHRDRVYYLSESAMRMAISVARPNLVSLGTCLGKFSKSGKFKLHITALDYLAQYAKYKVGISPFPTAKLGRSEIPSDIWIKPNGEMPFLYGNHVVKAHLGRITEDTPEHQGVVVFNMNDVPLVRTMPLSIPSRSSYGLVHFIGHHCGFHPMIGFGVTSRSTVDTRKLDPTAIIVFHQADVGEYLRDEGTLF
ncbi:60S ribosome subunit protein nip7 [Ceratobasidium theobromae]|uniref:60S ribosome subunit protein nip7 n=1 Tax=Ceratobasidium theobromae TaxID=1582974 RepID=A0A5N5QRF2_9AGAM|nr:60S ribosome subunit protein nip7 [Ceratobasidium theobromae]